MKPNSHRPTLSLGFGIVKRKPEVSTEAPSEEVASNAQKPRILVVDHDPALRRVMLTRLSVAGYAVEAVNDAQSAIDSCARSRPNLIIVDLPLADADGLAFLKDIKGRWPHLAVIMLTAHGSISEAVKATQCGAFGYLVKPVEKEELLGQVGRAVADASNSWPATIASRNQLMQDRLAIANRAAASEEPILLTGEQGTGKELLARAIHAASARRGRAFVAISCQKEPAESLERALFGNDSEPGAWQRALEGTLLIDAIEQMPLSLQATLWRALSKDPMRAHRAGAAPSGVRLICTTSVDLKPMVDSGAFLKGLHDEISILPIEIPPLGRRREDIPLMVSHFLEQAVEPGGQKKIYSSKAIELLAVSDWPGNVRQLFDLVKQNIALSRGKVITEDFVQQSLNTQPVEIPTYDEARDQFARDYLEQSLQRTSGNVSQAARLAKRNRTDFYKLLTRYRLNPDDFKNPAPEPGAEPTPDEEKKD
jgi:two-component system, NtrC family, response regulator GlrR